MKVDSVKEDTMETIAIQVSRKYDERDVNSQVANNDINIKRRLYLVFLSVLRNI